MTKKAELSPETVAQIEKRLVAHVETLRTLHREAVDRAQKYVLFTNSGAVIALLGFMGSNADVRSSPTMWAALIAFVLGIVCCGVVLAIGFHQTEVQFLGWIRDTNSFLSGDGDHEATTKNLDARNRKVGWFPVVFAYLAWFAFLFGVGTSLVYMFNKATNDELKLPVAHSGAMHLSVPGKVSSSVSSAPRAAKDSVPTVAPPPARTAACMDKRAGH